MRYAKLTDGYLQFHSISNPIKNPDGTFTVTSNPDILRQNGFYPVVNSPMPHREGYHYDHSWGVVDGVMTDIWTEVEDVIAEVHNDEPAE